MSYDNTKSKDWLKLVLLIYVPLAFIYSITAPIMETWDEPWHFPFVEHLSKNGFALPVQDPSNPQEWRQQAGQPPLYYFITALAIAPIDTSDMEMVRRLNPYAAIGTAQPDGNQNIFVHRPELESFPWRGTTLAVLVARWISILMSIGTVLITYRIASILFPKNMLVIFGAVAFNAFLPMFVYLSASVSNDNLSNLLGSLLTLMLIQLINRTSEPGIRWYTGLGIVTGAALLSKLSFGFLIPLIAITLALLSWRFKSWKPLLVGGIISGGLTVLIAGWWYIRNWQLYGDPTGLDIFFEFVGSRNATLNQIWSERFSFARAYWGSYGSINIFWPDFVYIIFDMIGITALIGAVVYVIRSLPQWDSKRALSLGITLLWPVILFISLISWTSSTHGSQGRLLFPAISSLSLWMAVGLSWWIPPKLRLVPIGAVTLFFLMISALAPFIVIQPAYASPEPVSADGQVLASFRGGNTDRIAGQIDLIGYEIETTTLKSGENLNISLDWKIESPFTGDWSLFVHLVTPDGVLVAQRDTFPGGGKMGTSDLKAGFAWHNPVTVHIPFTTPAPLTLELLVGWYNFTTGERLQTTQGDDALLIGDISLTARTSETGVSNPIGVSFGGIIELVGYEIDQLSALADETITLTLYWRKIGPIEDDYRVFANVIDNTTLEKFAESNGMPVGWTRPTTSWQNGEMITDVHELTIKSDATPGLYEVEVGLYRETSTGEFERLLTLSEAGEEERDRQILSRVRIRP